MLLICCGFILSACEQNIDTIPVEPEVAFAKELDPNAPGPITISLGSNRPKFNGIPPLVIIVENGIESILDGNLSDVDLQSISRFTVVKGKDAVGKYTKFTDIIKHHDGIIKLYKK